MKKAFTLIELLVVISIIAVLMAVLLPAMKRVREQAKQVVCSSNLHQLALGMEMYLQTHNNRIPMAEPRFRNQWNMNHSQDNWFLNEALLNSSGVAIQYNDEGLIVGPESEKSILICPSHRNPQMSRHVNDAMPAVERPYELSYMMNGTMGRGTRAGFEAMPRKAIEFKRPSETMMFCDENGTFYSEQMPATPGIVLYDACPKENFEFRHNDQSNILYLDGHSNYLKQKQVPFTTKRLDPIIFKPFWSEKLRRR